MPRRDFVTCPLCRCPVGARKAPYGTCRDLERCQDQRERREAEQARLERQEEALAWPHAGRGGR